MPLRMLLPLDDHQQPACLLTAADAPLLQRLYDANPDYFLITSGEPATPTSALEEIEETPPPEMPFDQKLMLGFGPVGGSVSDLASGELYATAEIVTNLLAPGVWHIGLFLVDTKLRGNGVAQRLMHQIEHWAKANGAAWLRLGVVVGNTRAERFWQRCGFIEVRQRTGVVMGHKTNTLRVMVKPLDERGLDEYLQLVARDRPETHD